MKCRQLILKISFLAVFLFTGCGGSEYYLLSDNNFITDPTSKKLESEILRTNFITFPTKLKPSITISVTKNNRFSYKSYDNKIQVQKSWFYQPETHLLTFSLGWVIFAPFWIYSSALKDNAEYEIQKKPETLKGEIRTKDAWRWIVVEWQPTGAKIKGDIKTKIQETTEILNNKNFILSINGNSKNYISDAKGQILVDLLQDFNLYSFDRDDKIELKISATDINIYDEIILDPKDWTVPFVKIMANNENVFNAINGQKKGVVKAGLEYKIQEENANYYRIDYDDGVSWIKKSTGKKFWSIPERFDPKNPPQIEIKSIAFEEPSNDGFLDAEETGIIKINVLNTGKGAAHRLKAKLTDLKNNARELSYSSELNIGTLQSSKSTLIELPVTAPLNVTSNEQTFKVEISETNGYDAEPIEVAFKTRAFRQPELILADQGIEDANNNGRIETGESIDITARIQNRGQGQAKNVKATVIVDGEGQNIFYDAPSKEFELGTIKSGDYKDIKFSIATNKRFQKDKLPINISLEEQHKKFDKTIALELPLSKSIQKIHELIVSSKDVNTEIQNAGGLSIDIENNIPEARSKNSNAIALIVAISDYQNKGVPKVEFANRDASLMRQYLEKALGYENRNILPPNPDEMMTAGTMKTYIKKILPSYLKPDGSSEVFIYYVGHGAPSTTEQEAFFVPYDCNPNYVSKENAYSVKELYNDIKALKASRKIIVVDACFSGQSGSGEMLIKNASPIYLTVDNQLSLDENSIVFQSSEAKQVSNWYPEKQHSMFTYFFLKGLQGNADKDMDGNITAIEMEQFINDENDGLPYWSNRKFQRPQKSIITGQKDCIISKY